MGETGKGLYGRYWDIYVDMQWPEVQKAGEGNYVWPGDEWGTPEVWNKIFAELFVSSDVAKWQRAVEIGPGSGKYTVKVLDSSPASVRAYDVSARFLETCQDRCRPWIEQERLALQLLEVERADHLLSDLSLSGWRRTVDAFYSIGAMVHVDLQYLIAYILTAGLALKPGGKLILTLANAAGDLGFNKLLSDIRPYYPAQGKLSPKYEWLSPDLVQSILPRLGFRVDLLSDVQRDLHVVATLVEPGQADPLEHYLLPLPPP